MAFKDEERRRYSKEYYEKNKDALLEKKRRRYEEDPEYRKRVNQRSVERQRKNRLSIKRRQKNAKDPKMFKIMIDGSVVELQMYTLKQLAVALDKSIKTLRGWEDRGILPKALYRDTCGTAGNRLYPKFQFDKILFAYAESIREDTKHRVDTRVGSTSLPERLQEIWDKYPKGVDPTSL